MARLLLFSLMVGLAATPGCGSNDSKGPAVVAGAPAARVGAVHGTVTAVRGEARRPLAMGDVVSGDDVIETGPDGRVTIVIDHNQVPFSLGPGRQQQVAASPAWKAPRGSAVAVTSTDRSGAAGRHAEREAADTLASTSVAAEPSATPPPSAAPTPAPAAAPPPPAPAAAAAAPPPAPPPAREEGRAALAEPEVAAAAPPPPPPPAPPDPPADRAALRADDDAPGVGDLSLRAGGGGGGAGGGATGTSLDRAIKTRSLSADAPKPGPSANLIPRLKNVETKGGLTGAQVLTVARAAAPALRACAGPAPTATSYDLLLHVDPSGSVRAATGHGGTGEVNTCLIIELRKLTFPPAQATTTARLKLDLVKRR